VNQQELPDGFFRRQDESPDAAFYAQPRFTTHIDDATIDAITNYYAEVLSTDDRLLDLMSSWISHLPPDIRYRSVHGLGMNAEELERNPRLDEHVVKDLNDDPTLPYIDGQFDAVMIVVSIQYLTQPFDVFREIARVLDGGGRCIVAMSHRLFPTKAVFGFQSLPPNDRCRLVASYLEQTGLFGNIQLLDRSPINADPLWIVSGQKHPETL
jgi:SAM-dependent methyltransferase